MSLLNRTEYLFALDVRLATVIFIIVFLAGVLVGYWVGITSDPDKREDWQ